MSANSNEHQPAAAAAAAVTSATATEQQQPPSASATAAPAAAANAEKTTALIARDFDKLRQAPPNTTKEAFGADNFKRVQKISEGNDFKFWKSQPQPSFDEPDPEPENSGPIEQNKSIDEIRKEPYNLPADFEWSDVPLSEKKHLDEVYDLLSNHYVEDDDNMFRFNYPHEFLQWALLAPGWRSEYHIGVRLKSTSKLVAMITAIPCNTRVYDKSFKAVEINFLCIHKKLRDHRLAPVLILEVTRRVNLNGTFQAVYTAGAVIPKPIAIARYWHRTINAKKLIGTTDVFRGIKKHCKFTSLQPHMTIARTIKLYKLPTETKIPMRKMEARDVSAIHALLNAFLKKFNLANDFSEEEVAHWLLPRDMVMYSYVVEDPKTKAITDLVRIVSFYHLPSTVINNPKHTTIKAAYSYYTIPNRHTLEALMSDALILASNEHFDVFNSLDVLDYGNVLKNLKFGLGDGNLHYYLYNYRAKTMTASQIGLVLL